MQNYNVRFVHGTRELRFARFVYPDLHPYDNEIRMNSPNTLSSPYGLSFWNLEQNYPVVNAQPTPTIITPMGQNVPVGYERELRRISLIHENVNSKNWRSTECNASDGDSGIGSTGINNSPEMNVKYRENLDDITYQFVPFQEPSLINERKVIPSHLLRPLDTLTNQEQTNFSRGEAYNHWLSTGAVQSHEPPGLEQMSWWPDIISNAYPFINRPS
ncbi:unnamed protein product [Onchocerca flexuosa]|uniref:Uncharacterized protein n=1 Tax=Onchocerca flexuosa TaxID=387005 RepID=A0A183H2B6_9BILA|nr:unnamed protein product [Onchocerca flexuosa]